MFLWRHVLLRAALTRLMSPNKQPNSSYLTLVVRALIYVVWGIPSDSSE